MTFHESYGDVSVAQLRAYKRHNVSPSDHDSLVDVLGNDPAAIVAAVLEHSTAGNFQVFTFWKANR